MSAPSTPAADADIVVGSGPAGVACARALVRRGRAVVMLDAGLEIEPEREAARAALAARDPALWTRREIEALTGPRPDGRGPPQKRILGSDYPYRAHPAAGLSYDPGLHVRASHARGGFSAVWGSAMLPYGACELRGWPITADDLADGYREALEFTPLAGVRDRLADRFPLFTDRLRPMPQSAQIAALLRDLDRWAPVLTAAGVSHGRARVAVEGEGCVACGLCLHGCPLHRIWRSTDALAPLIAERRIDYRPGLVVRAVEEAAGGVTVNAVAADGARISLAGPRVFLAAGAIGTTAILMRSLSLFDRAVRLRDSQYFLAPMLRLAGAPGVRAERLATLCQAFLEIDDPAVSPDTVHLQLYGYNDLLEDVIAARLGPLWRVAPQAAILGRLMLIQGYLHSDHSGRIAVRMDTQGAVHLAPEPAPGASAAVRRVMAKLQGLAPQFRGLVVGALAEVTEPGRGYHHGGAFPMTAEPAPLSTDGLGRPWGLQRIHAVDATVFPTVPAPTITLTVMANATRIADAVVRHLPEDRPQ